ncbi:MAG: EscU/YscU/HrcU family type III secretion system export apparatus switch protein [Pseudomonadota bacterium]
MSGDSTEEKVLPPTEHKLRKAREKGQVASSQDFVGACVTVAGLFFLVFTWPQIVAIFDRVLANSVSSIGRQDYLNLLTMLLSMFYDVGYLVAGLGIVLIIVGIGANILHKQGIPFSLHPVKPDFKKINPGEGLKKMFKRRNAAEFGVSAFRLFLWFTASGLLIWFFFQSIMTSALCDNGCLLNEANRVVAIFMVMLVILLMFSGLADLPMQFALFRHEQKMGHKELKRELKDTLGSPEFRQHRKSEYQEMLNEAVETAEASFYLRSNTVMLGLYYNAAESPVPKLVSIVVEAQHDRVAVQVEAGFCRLHGLVQHLLIFRLSVLPEFR